MLMSYWKVHFSVVVYSTTYVEKLNQQKNLLSSYDFPGIVVPCLHGFSRLTGHIDINQTPCRLT